jgi:hypothetical protein
MHRVGNIIRADHVEADPRAVALLRAGVEPRGWSSTAGMPVRSMRASISDIVATTGGSRSAGRP